MFLKRLGQGICVVSVYAVLSVVLVGCGDSTGENPSPVVTDEEAKEASEGKPESEKKSTSPAKKEPATAPERKHPDLKDSTPTSNVPPKVDAGSKSPSENHRSPQVIPTKPTAGMVNPSGTPQVARNNGKSENAWLKYAGFAGAGFVAGAVLATFKERKRCNRMMSLVAAGPSQSAPAMKAPPVVLPPSEPASESVNPAAAPSAAPAVAAPVAASKTVQEGPVPKGVDAEDFIFID